jgi:hypothetical protein
VIAVTPAIAVMAMVFPVFAVLPVVMVRVAVHIDDAFIAALRHVDDAGRYRLAVVTHRLAIMLDDRFTVPNHDFATVLATHCGTNRTA